MRSLLALVVAVAAGVALAGCEITVCELNEEDNVCDEDADCLLAYCGTNCCPCEVAVSRRQFQSTYCMVEASEGFDAARRECREARETVCDGVSCRGTTVCARPTRAVCDDGRCVGGYL